MGIRRLAISFLTFVAATAWAGPPECPGIGADGLPLTGTSIECSGSNCATGVGSALETIAVQICGLGMLPAECGRCECCRKPSVDLFAGSTLTFTGDDPDQYCGLGGRGRQMGEAALCMLRDLAAPARAPSAGGSGIHLERTASLGIGNVSVEQHIGFQDFSLPMRRMRGFHSVSVCAPVLGCISSQTQPFTATLLQVTDGSGSCGDYAFVNPSWVLRVDTEQQEHGIGVDMGPFVVVTPVGPVNVTPRLNYELNLEAVTSPWAENNGGVEKDVSFCATSPQFDVLGANAGVLASIVAGGGQVAGRGWDAFLGLGTRDPDPAGALWTPAGQDFPKRPDFEFGTARKAREKRPTGRLLTGVDVSYGVGDLGSKLNFYPLSLDRFEAYVKSSIDAAFVSQFAMRLDEGRLAPLPPDCTTNPETSVTMQSAVDAFAELSVKAGVIIDFSLDLGFFTKHFSVHPEVNVIPPANVPESLVTGPDAAAEMLISSPPPAYPAQYAAFSAFSSAAVDGRAFVDACLSEPPPAPQVVPTPVIDPGDPLDLIKPLKYPCNICLYFPGSVTQACVPKQTLVDGGIIPADYVCDLAINGMPCTDPNCENVVVSPPVSIDLKEVLFPVSQAGLPGDKQWNCNAFEKFGCFDLCSYDPEGAQPLVITESAVDAIGTRCRDATGGSDPSKNGMGCTDASDCDDGNPCTEDQCRLEGEIYLCRFSQSTGSCDDGLYCNGTDSCALGICGSHSGNPCTATSACCNEAGDSCPASCPNNPCAGKNEGDACNDGSVCTTNDHCVPTLVGLLCHGDGAVSCESTACTAGLCQEADGQAECATVPNGACLSTCGNGTLDPGEECDLPVDSNCPGRCLPDCYCDIGDTRDGDPCTDPGQCASGFCADGVCCDSACLEPNLQCDLPGKQGTCGVIRKTPLLSPPATAAAAVLLLGLAGRALRRRR